MNETITMKTIPYAEWRAEIAPLWAKSGAERFIPHVIEGAGQMQYMGRERLRSILVFPIAAMMDGERVGWTSIYNVSDEAVRVRGIYVLPEFRSNGVGYKMVDYAMKLWPEPWNRCYMYARQSNVERYLRWGFVRSPNAQARSWAEGKSLGADEIMLMEKPLRGNSVS